MGQAIDTNGQEQYINDMAYRPIHTYLADIIPYLVQRLEMAKSIQNITDNEHINAIKEMINYTNKEIKIILNIPNEPFTKK